MKKRIQKSIFQNSIEHDGNCLFWSKQYIFYPTNIDARIGITEKIQLNGQVFYSWHSCIFLEEDFLLSYQNFTFWGAENTRFRTLAEESFFLILDKIDQKGKVCGTVIIDMLLLKVFWIHRKIKLQNISEKINQIYAPSKKINPKKLNTFVKKHLPMKTHIQESTLYPDLIQYLKEQGFDAIGETKFKDSQTRPDILFRFQGQTFVLEIKLDDIKIGTKATAQAYRYAQKLNTQNFIVLIFPKQLRNETLFGQEELKKLVLKTPVHAEIFTEKWSGTIPKITFIDFVARLKEAFSEKKDIQIDFESVVNRINSYVSDFNHAVYRFNQESLEKEIVDKLDLFASIGDFKDKESAKKQVLHLASFLLFNQILFFHIFHKKTKRVAEIQEVQKVADLAIYFDQIQEIDYKSIYKVNILGHIPQEDFILEMLNDLILSIKSLRAEHITHDLAGRFFHELIPHEVRKVLAAFYTHPNAADLLAGILIDNPEDTAIDPACGSGTLMVAAYKRKEYLYNKFYGYSKKDLMHKNFVENDLTGIDIMPFAAHISTINLTMQNIEQVTNIVRFATRDSLELAKATEKGRFSELGLDIQAYTETIQGQLIDMVETKTIKKGAINPEGDSVGFKLNLSDVVIMNPPYSDKEKMPKAMQDKLNDNTALNKHCGNLVNLWGYFMILGDFLVKDEGFVGSVIPINFARGKATEKIRDFMLKNHTILYIIKPVGDLAFSEGAAFRDILLVTQKKKPEATDMCKIVYFKKSIRDFENKEMPKIYNQILRTENQENEIFDTFSVSQQELWDKQQNLMYFLWSKHKKDYEKIQIFYEQLLKKNVCNFPKGLVKEGFHSYTSGVIESVFVTNPKDEKTRIERAFMILEHQTEDYVTVRLGKTDFRYKIPKKILKKAIRTITGMRKIEVQEADYFITTEFKDFKEIISFSKFKTKGDFDWNYVEKTYPKKMVHLVSATKFDLYSPNTSFIAFYSDEPMIATDSLKVYPNLSQEQAKIICLYFNSIVNILQFITNRQQTTAGGYHAITETDLLNFQLIAYEKLSEKEKNKLLGVFDAWKTVSFPSIVEQIASRFEGRLAMDRAILEVLGYKKSEINELLPALYEVVLRELKADF